MKVDPTSGVIITLDRDEAEYLRSVVRNARGPRANIGRRLFNALNAALTSCTHNPAPASSRPDLPE